MLKCGNEEYAGIQKDISMASLTFDIPDDTHRKLKALAAGVGMTMKDFLISRALTSMERGDSGKSDDATSRLDDLLSPEAAVFKLSPENWEVFCQALDAPAKPNPSLRNLMSTSGVLDEQ